MSRLFKRVLADKQETFGLESSISIPAVAQSTIASWDPVLGKIDRNYVSLCGYSDLAAKPDAGAEDALVSDLQQFKNELLNHMKFVSTYLFVNLKQTFKQDSRLETISKFERETADRMHAVAKSIARCVQVPAIELQSVVAEFRYILNLLKAYHEEQELLLYPLYLESIRQELKAV